MSEETEAGPPLPSPRSVSDLSLAQIVRLVEGEADLALPVRLSASGSFVQGSLIAGQSYWSALGSYVLVGQEEVDDEDGPAEVTVGQALNRIFRRRASMYEMQGAPEMTALEYLHLRDASAVMPGAVPLDLGLWRLRLDKVDAWSLGTWSYPMTD